MIPGPEHEAATFAATLEPDDIPSVVQDRAGLVLADTVGAIVGGSTDPAVQTLADTWAQEQSDGSPGRATVLGSDGSAGPPPAAAFLNGTAGTVLELDEGHRFAAGHPAIHVVPALLADGEAGNCTAEDFLAGLVAGYEVAVRTARAVTPLADGYHPHGVWGAVGGAAAVARVRNRSPETTHTAMSIAANYAQHTRFEAATRGATVRNSYAGMNNLAAMVAVDQADAGFTGLADGVSRHLRRAAAGEVEPDRLAADLGDRWELQHGYFKRHAACRYTHAALDAVEHLRADGPIDPDTVDAVRIETYPAAASLTTMNPRNALEAKFSLPYAVAAALVTGETGRETFDPGTVDERVLSVAERISVEVTDEFADRAPDKRGARVTIERADGPLSASVTAARGGDHDPFTEPELREKFINLTEPVVGPDRAAALWDGARDLNPPRQICALG